MNTTKTDSPSPTESAAACSQSVNRAFKLGGAGISGASAGALVGSAIAGAIGGMVGAVIVAGANMALNSRNERDDSCE
jgi:hypothetical protein